MTNHKVSYEQISLIENILSGYLHKDRENSRCVLFVHGIFGSASDTWRKDKTSNGLIKIILEDHDLRDYDAFSFNYHSKYIRGAPIDNAAKQLHNAVATISSKRSYKISLIAHSMGGLVCMRYILDELQSNIIPPITGLLMYGTPTTGAELINVARIVWFGIGTQVPFFSALANAFLTSQRQVTDLARGSAFLARLHDEWALHVVNGGHEKAGNQRMWLPVRVVTGEKDVLVSEASGKGVYGAIDWLPLTYSHIQLVKPETDNDPRYLCAKRFLQMCRLTKDINILENKGSPPRGAGYSEQRELTLLVELPVA